MKTPTHWVTNGAALVWALLVFGCSSPNVNPGSPKLHVGYIDLYADSPGEFCWAVHEVGPSPDDLKKVFYDLSPVQGRILRLALPPGPHRLRVTFLDRVVTKPVEVEVEIHESEITPVRVSLAPEGNAFVKTKETSAGGTAYGRYGRRTKIGSYETSMFALTAQTEAPVPYQRKEQMPYAH